MNDTIRESGGCTYSRKVGRKHAWMVCACREKTCKCRRMKPRKTIRETIRNDLEVNEFDPNMVYDRTLWRNLVHITDPT